MTVNFTVNFKCKSCRADIVLTDEKPKWRHERYTELRGAEAWCLRANSDRFLLDESPEQQGVRTDTPEYAALLLRWKARPAGVTRDIIWKEGGSSGGAFGKEWFVEPHLWVDRWIWCPACDKGKAFPA